MDLVAAFSGQPVQRGLRRDSGQITADQSADLADPHCQYTLGLWLASPIQNPAAERTKPEAFGALMAEAFPVVSAATAALPADIETSSPADPGLDRERWLDTSCPACGTDNWYWRHCCRSCRKDSTGYYHWLHKCTCQQCAEERGWHLESAEDW